ncbi:MAG: helix-turn-helix transcriptional regulator [Bacilli bacterium]|nr:helix-turn-helix transcriptional regulator [Bacilli bacterium]
MKMLPVIDLVKTGNNIKSLLAQNNISVTKLQDILGFTSPQAIYKWFWGQSLPSVDNLVILASILHVSIEDILVIE